MRFKRSDFERVTKNTAVGALLERRLSAEREKEGRESLGDIYINLWLLPSGAGAPSAGMWTSPFQILTQARLQLHSPQPAPFPEHSLKEIFKL